MFSSRHLPPRLRFILRLALALVLISPAASASPVSGAPARSSAPAASAANLPAAPVQPEALDFTQIAAGAYHTCAITAGGGVMCWGDNLHGQLGDGTYIQRSTPVDVVGLASGVTALAADYGHTCALLVGGGVKCWGGNGSGQLGDGTNAESRTPVDVIGLAGSVTMLTAGADYTCVQIAGGGVQCWGNNFAGQLGDGTTQNRFTPVDVVGLASGVTALTAGGKHTCALLASGGARCWGENYSGQLGDGTTEDKHTPVDVVGLASSVTALAAGGYHTCAVLAGGGVQCWGWNVSGQLGDGTTETRLTPVDVVGLASGVTALAADNGHTCALLAGGGVQCWGQNDFGQLGDGTTEDKHTPVYVVGLASGVTALAAGVAHTCAVLAGGGARCWGDNRLYGQLGHGTLLQRSTPVEVAGLANGVTAMAEGYAHTCALTAVGGVQCWGLNLYGYLGDGTYTQRSTPVDVVGLASGVTALAANIGHTCALLAGGGVKCWGENGYGQLGDGTNGWSPIPVDVVGLASGVTVLVAGGEHTCALLEGGGVKCWGMNSYGQLGDGTIETKLTPVDVVGLASGVTALAAGDYHTCALTASGGVQCWGWNGYGQLGDGTNNQRLTPVDVVGLASGVTALAAGGEHTCAVAAGGGVQCWGWNVYGQLGDGTTDDRYTPVDVVDLAGGITALVASSEHTCAVAAGGGVQCWGWNSYGQLGDGTTEQRLTPASVLGLGSNASLLSAGSMNTCALAAGRPKCWGDDDHGQLGVGTLFQYPTPVEVGELTQVLSLSYPNGQPGSYFTVTGWNFPVSSTVTIAVNRYVFTTTLTVNETGTFVFFLDTSDAEAGYYLITASAGPTAGASFVLDPEAPVRPMEGGGLTLRLPAGVGDPWLVYLPLVSHWGPRTSWPSADPLIGESPK